MQRAATAFLVALATTIFADIPQSQADTARKPAVTELELLFGAIRPADDLKSSETELPFTRFVSMEEICTTIETAAADHELPVSFFARLIWQESRFRPYAVSPAGAQGIAQFMPITATWRGVNPLDPIQSLHKSADYLRELRKQFGNLGLAAAAYNGGSGRVQAWLNGRGGLPVETRQYVHIVTGSPADQWRGKEIRGVQTNKIPAKVPCPELVAMAAAAEEEIGIQEPAQQAAAEVQRAAKAKQSNWAVLLAGSFSRDKAQERSAMLQRKFRAVLDGHTPTIVKGRVASRGKARMSQIRVAETDRASAEKLCAKLRAGGASCVVKAS
jgi:soluble lytic murein transglycosylase-like protein